MSCLCVGGAASEPDKGVPSNRKHRSGLRKEEMEGEMKHLNSLRSKIGSVTKLISLPLLLLGLVGPGLTQAGWQEDWEQAKAAARKEGKIVVNIPPSAELRKQLGAAMKKKFGINVEIVPARGSAVARRIADEFKSGIHYFDVYTGTYGNYSHRLRPLGALDPLKPYWILPEVKDPKNWWGGHFWGDKGKRFGYLPSGYELSNVWYNSQLVRPEEIQSYNDLLNPKWTGKIGLLDPRLPGAGRGLWAFLWARMGADYLKKLAQGKLVLGKRRTLADQLAKGKLAITLGPTFFTFQPFTKAGLPAKPIPPLKEGMPVSTGNGGPVVIKNPPHPNATKVFINWLLSKEGQELYSKALGQATRRLDVDTKWMTRIGVRAAKDFLSQEDFFSRENQSEEQYTKVRIPALKFAREIFK